MPNLGQKLSRLKKILSIASLKKKSGFLNKALRPRSLRSLVTPTAEAAVGGAWACWNKVIVVTQIYENICAHFRSEEIFYLHLEFGYPKLR